jgi:hypothetical protein
MHDAWFGPRNTAQSHGGIDEDVEEYKRERDDGLEFVPAGCIYGWGNRIRSG